MDFFIYMDMKKIVSKNENCKAESGLVAGMPKTNNDRLKDVKHYESARVFGTPKTKNDRLEIVGGKKLFGRVEVQTSKNATLPILSACLLIDDEVTIKKIPQISDISNMIEILSILGVKVEKCGENLKINATKCKNLAIDDKLIKAMRSSIFLLSPMLSRFKYAVITAPGGCKIGARPIDIHLSILKEFGVKFTEIGTHIVFDATNVRAKKIHLRFPSVGATENAIMFASRLKGKTILTNVAKEPEVVDLCNFLGLAGTKILGAGTDKITIYGVDNLCGAQYTPMADRIVAGTIMCAVAGSGGDVEIVGGVPYQNLKLIEILGNIGCKIEIKNDIIHIISEGNLSPLNHVETGVYPEFPTDLQSMILPVVCKTPNETIVKENIFENRFLMANELKKMNANLEILDERTISVKESALKGAVVEAKDLRGGAGLVLAGLFAKGKTIITGVENIDRGYENIETLFSNLGADIKRICQRKK